MALGVASHQLAQSPQSRTALPLSPVHLEAWVHQLWKHWGHSSLSAGHSLPQCLSISLSPVSGDSRESLGTMSLDPQAQKQKAPRACAQRGVGPTQGYVYSLEKSNPERLFWKVNMHLGSLDVYCQWLQV